MKKLILTCIVLSGVVVLSGCVTNNAKNQDTTQKDLPEMTQVLSTQKGLNAEQQKALIYLIQEERLARDVYMTMYNTWGIKKFYNIFNAEENHQALVANLLEKYGIQNPNNDKELGQFEDTELLSLYTILVEKGKVSSQEAIQVGIKIEEKDITDIQNMMKSFDGYSDIQSVLQKLLEGSKRHLQAFRK